MISSAGCREVTSIKDTSSCVALRHLRSTYKGTGLRKQSDAWFDLTRTLRPEAELIDSADLMSFYQTRQDTFGPETAPRSGVARAGESFIGLSPSIKKHAWTVIDPPFQSLAA